MQIAKINPTQFTGKFSKDSQTISILNEYAQNNSSAEVKAMIDLLKADKGNDIITLRKNEPTPYYTTRNISIYVKTPEGELVTSKLEHINCLFPTILNLKLSSGSRLKDYLPEKNTLTRNNNYTALKDSIQKQFDKEFGLTKYDKLIERKKQTIKNLKAEIKDIEEFKEDLGKNLLAKYIKANV